MRILYKYLTTSLFPRHSEPEVRRPERRDDLYDYHKGDNEEFKFVCICLSVILCCVLSSVGWQRLSSET